MSSSMNPIKNFGWFAIIFLVVILLYPLSLNVASLRGDLMKIDSNILTAQKEINYLQAELRARANLQQLEEWNDLLYGYQSPTAAQFANGEKALANLGKSPVNIRPVLVSAHDSVNGDAPTGVIGSPFAPLKTAKVESVGEKQISAKKEVGTKEVKARIASIDELLDSIEDVKIAQNENDTGERQ